MAAALAGCATPVPAMDPRVAIDPGLAPVPDNVDYVMAVQCGGLLWALQAASYRTWDSGPLLSVTGQYREWAELRAREAGQDPKLALADMAASRDNFLREVGPASLAFQADALRAAYPGDVKACRSLAKAADYDLVFVGG
jgi:hypothetical protein